MKKSVIEMETSLLLDIIHSVDCCKTLMEEKNQSSISSKYKLYKL